MNLRSAIVTIACVASVVVSQDARAQHSMAISGTVVDSLTREPIAGVTVQLVEIRRTDLTHTDGTFHFDQVPDGSYTVRLTRIGLRPAVRSVSVSGGRSAPISVSMTQSAIELNAVVTTGTLSARNAQDVLSPTGVVQGADLDRKLENTLAATLQNEPGVTMSTLGPATARPVIRGLTGDRVVILEDGQRAADMSATSSDHAVSIDPANVKQIEVVRGPMSLLYGSSALGGVVNAVRDEIPNTLSEHVSGAVTAGGSSVDDGRSVGGYATASRGSVGGRLDGTVRKAGNQRTPLGELDNTQLDTWSVSGGASLLGDNRHAGAAYRYYSNSYGVPGGFVGGHANGVTIDMRKHNARGEAEVFRPGATFSSLKASGTFTKYNHEEIEAGGSLGTSFDQIVTAGDLIARHGEHARLTEGAVGARWQYRDIQTGGSLRTPSTYDNTGALFAVEELGFGALKLQSGVRFDWARYVPYQKGAVVIVNGVAIPARPRTFASPSGSVGLLYDAGSGVHLGASVARAYRTPDFNELYSNGPHLAAFSFDVGNPELGQETGIGTDVFARLNRDRIHGEIAAFSNRMNGFIYARNTGDIGLQGNRPKFQFTGRRAQLVGGEGSLEATLTRAFVLETTISYVRGTFLGKVDSLPADTAHGVLEPRPGSTNIPLMPPANGHAGLRYEGQRWNASLGTRFAAAQKNLGDFESETAGYGLLDATLGLRLLERTRFHAVTLRGQNLLNRAYRNHMSRTKDVMPEAGRDVSLVYRITF